MKYTFRTIGQAKETSIEVDQQVPAFFFTPVEWIRNTGDELLITMAHPFDLLITPTQISMLPVMEKEV